MWKLNLIAILTLIGFLAIIIQPVIKQNEEYWKNIGPSWDQMLNPNKYSNEE